MSIQYIAIQYNTIQYDAMQRHTIQCHTKAKQPESSDLCGNITEFGVAKDHLSPQGKGDPYATPNEVLLPYNKPDEGCFVFISYCLMVLSYSKLRYTR